MADLKVNRYTFMFVFFPIFVKKDNSSDILFTSLIIKSSIRSTLKGKNLLLWSKFCPLRFGNLIKMGAKMKTAVLLPLVVYLITLTSRISYESFTHKGQ